MLSRHNLGCELLNLIGVVLLVYHVETRNQTGVGAAAHLNVVEHLLNVRVPHDLEACDHEHELEVWHSLFGFVDDLLDDLQLIEKTKMLAVIVQEHTADVSQLHHVDILLDARLYGVTQQDLEEFVVLS